MKMIWYHARVDSTILLLFISQWLESGCGPFLDLDCRINHPHHFEITAIQSLLFEENSMQVETSFKTMRGNAWLFEISISRISCIILFQYVMRSLFTQSKSNWGNVYWRTIILTTSSSSISLINSFSFDQFTFGITFNFISLSRSTISSKDGRSLRSSIQRCIVNSRMDGKTNLEISRSECFMTTNELEYL
jgi:hypothetical protein